MVTLLDRYQFPILIILEHIAPLLFIALLSIFFIKKIYSSNKRKNIKTHQTKDKQNLSLYHQVAESIALDSISPDVAPLYISTNTS